MDENIKKTGKRSNLTPEQEQKVKKIAIVGIVILSVLLAALIITIVTVFVLQKTKKEDEVKNPFDENKVVLVKNDLFDKMLSTKTINDFTDEKIKDEILNKNSCYIFIYDNTLEKETINEVNKVYEKKDRDFAFICLNLDDDKENIVKNIKQFIKLSEKIKDDSELEKNEVVKKEIEKVVNQKIMLLKIDAPNLHQLGESDGIGEYYIEGSKVKSLIKDLYK